MNRMASVEYLGVTLKPQLFFNKNINNIRNKDFSKLGCVNHCNDFINLYALKKYLFFTGPRSQIEYVTLIWSPNTIILM